MRQQVVDIETYPNYFLACFEDYLTKEKWSYEISEYVDQRADLIKHMTGSFIFIGYNIDSFDAPVLRYVLRERSKINAEMIFKKSQMIIEGQKDKADWDVRQEYNLFRKKYRRKDDFKTVDLLTLMFSKKQRVSLKEMEVSMCWPKVQDLPIHYTDLIKEEEREIVKDYCFNDVGATKELCKRLASDIDLRIQIGKTYGLSCLSKDGVKTGVDLFAKMYEEEVGSRDFLQGRSPRPEINLANCISDKVQFKSKAFNDLLNKMKATTITGTKGTLDFSVVYGGVRHDYGTGGIHSKDRPGVIQAPKGWIYQDADVDSLYPSLLILLGACPEHLDPNIFIPKYKEIRDTRIKAKREKNKIVNETLKLSLNGTYGNLISKYSWLYDPKAAMMITLNGQLFLSMLSERLTDAGFKVDSLNTDGITCFYPPDKKDLYNQICKEWSEHTGLTLEFALYHKVFRRDVNSYIAWYADDKGQPMYTKEGKPYVKEKGYFLQDLKLGKGYDKPIVKKALYNYFIFGTPIEQTIYAHDNIYDFCMMQKMDSKFKAIWNDKALQKTNRFYAAKGMDAGYLYKMGLDKKENMKKSHVLSDSGVMIFNDYKDLKVDGKVPLKNYNINYDYYINEARAIQRAIEPEQLSLF
jgi:hypothetical protein